MNKQRLKSLELNGYKTFASRTIFEFAGQITAIVGPNGSGKSNIADALRWVLGEQSYTLLRGRKTEDMIFAGSETRSRAGMVSVTVTFDNSEGWLPIDFNEVSITRNAFRDGQNEYLINQQKVRLKDITELLAQSGLAERTYTIIGQGLLDTALTLKSEERRRLFEEAAGIGLYRARKEQSLRRLDATRRNLERVEDILSELKPRLRSLERQAARADEFSKLRAELRETLRQWYGYHWNQSQNELQQLRQVADAREVDLGMARDKQSELGRELNHLRGRTQQLRAQLSQWQHELTDLNASREGASKGLAVAEERQKALTERRAALGEEAQRLELELSGLETRQQELQKDAERFQAEVEEAQQNLNEARNVLQGKQASHQENEGKERELRDRVLQLQAEQANAKAQQELLSKRIDKSKNEAAELARTIDGMEQDLIGARERLAELERTVGEKQKKVGSTEDEQVKILEEKNQLEVELSAAEKDRDHLRTRQVRLEAELKGLEEAELASVGFAEGAKLLLQAAKENRLRLGKGTLGKELNVSSEHEVAIAAALGTYLDAVLLLEDKDPESALLELQNKQASGALIPLQSLTLDGRLEPRQRDGLVGVAADLVQTSAQLRPVVNLLLGRVLVATDRHSARSLMEIPGAAQVVTLQGEVFHRGGQIEVRSPKIAGGLARPRAQRELRNELDDVSTKLTASESNLDRLCGENESVNQNRVRSKQAVEEARQALSSAERELLSQHMEAAQLERQQVWFKEQLRGLENEQSEGNIKLGELSAKAGGLAADLEDAAKALDAHSQLGQSIPLDEEHAQAAHWEMQLVVSQRALQEGTRRGTERQQQIERAQGQLVAQRERAKELEEQFQAIEREKLNYLSQESSIGEQIEQLLEKITPAEAELVKSEHQSNEFQQGETQALQALSAAERNHTQAQIALARQQETLETLRNRIEDDFGLVLFEYESGVSGPTPLPLGDLVEKLPKIENLPSELEDLLKAQRAQIRRLGAVNPEAQQEFIQVKERVKNMQEQVTDLRAAEEDLTQVIAELDVLMDNEFRKTFDNVASEFRDIFSRLFSGGSAKLLLTEEADMTTTGIDIEARLPGKRTQRLALLSGGERSLTATALIFALLKASSTPFCVLDEVDAMLDDANIGRFTELLSELSRDTQFVLITHNRTTVQVAGVIYGITMGRDTASQVISLKLDEVSERYAE